MKPILVFYAGLLYGEYMIIDNETRLSLPDDCYIHWPGGGSKYDWYRKDLTPRQPDDVPKELRLLVLLLS